MSVRTYTAKDGLVSPYVYGALQDKLGYLWIGSPFGLSRFDGKHFTNYGLSNGLPDSRASGACMDSRLRIWAATPSGTVELKGTRFVSYPLSDSLSDVLETGEDPIWSLTSAGVYQFNFNKWQKIKLYPGYENHACRKIIETKEGLYINYGDLLVFGAQNGTYKIIGKLKALGYYYNQLSISAGQIFVSTLDGIYEIKDHQLVKMSGLLGELKGIYSYFRDSKKRFWVAKNTMGIQYLPEGDTSHFVPVVKPPVDFVPGSISEDNHGNIWAGSGKGLIRISEMEFKIFDAASITGNKILRNVLQPPIGPLLINNGSMTLRIFANGGVSEKKLFNKGNSALPNNELIIDNYAFDDKGRYWYYLRGFALALQEGDNVYIQTRRLAHLGDEVFDVEFDNYRKKILVAVRTKKFPCQFNDTSYSVLPVNNDIEVKGNLMRLHQCTNGIILFATDQGSIFSIDKQNICKLQLDEFGKQGRISWFYNDPFGDVWIIYAGRGLRRYSWQNDSLIFREELTKANGLPSDNVSSLCFDNKNNLWVCTNSAITIFSKKINELDNQTYQISSFFNADDLQVDGVDPWLVKDNEGHIWVFSSNYLTCFYPEKLNFNTAIPSLSIENIELNFRQTDWAAYADSLTGIFQTPYNLRLSHENNTLGIYFKGISSSGTDGIEYSYQLEGLGSLWSIASSNDFVSFVKLPPGKYVFKVKAQLPNTNWSEPAVFSFEIKKAFWQTWWFYFLAVLFLVTGIYVLFRYRLMQKIKLFEMRNRISQDLHDDIGASMSGINLLSQIAADKLQHNKPDEASDYLLKVKNYSQDVIEKLSDIVWVFNPQNDSIEKLMQRLKAFSISVALSKNIKMHFVADKASETANLTIQQRKAIYLISKEAINNAFKSSECNNLYYHLTANGSKWQLRIQDDGKGFILTEKTDGNGLRNMQARADEIGAKFNIQSQPGAGTIILLEL